MDPSSFLLVFYAILICLYTTYLGAQYIAYNV